MIGNPPCLPDGPPVVAPPSTHTAPSMCFRKATLNMQIIRRHQKLQTQFRRYLHIGHVFRVFMLEVVVEILADFFEDDATTEFPISMQYYKEARRALGRWRGDRGEVGRWITLSCQAYTVLRLLPRRNLCCQFWSAFELWSLIGGEVGWVRQRTLWIEHLLDGAGDAGGVAADDELEAIAGDEGDVGGDRRGSHAGSWLWGIQYGGDSKRRSWMRSKFTWARDEYQTAVCIL